MEGGEEKKRFITDYESITAYSKRLKKQVKKNINVHKMTDKEERKKILDEFKQKILDDNEKYVLEKQQKLETDYFESTPNLKKISDEKNKLENANIDFVLDKLDKGTGNSIIIVGSSKAGKSYYMLKMLDEWLERDETLIPIFFCGNRTAPIYDKYNKKYPFFDGLKPSLIETLKLINSNLDLDKRYNFLLIFDDLICGMRNSNTIRNVALSYRNSMISSIFLIQGISLLIKNSRNSASIYLFGRTKTQECEGILNYCIKGVNYFHGVKTMADKINLYKESTRDYNFLLYMPNYDDDKLYCSKA